MRCSHDHVLSECAERTSVREIVVAETRAGGKQVQEAEGLGIPRAQLVMAELEEGGASAEEFREAMTDIHRIIGAAQTDCMSESQHLD
eukprot:351534-Rhodomonas_salina.1